MATSAVRQPPPEKPEAVRARTRIILQFWLIVLFLGLPTWHFTTSVFRASLPLESMLAPPEIPSVPLPIWIQANNHFTCRELDDIANRTQVAFDKKNTFFKTLIPKVKIVHEGGSSRCGEDMDSLMGIEPALMLQLELSREEYSLELIPSTDIAVVHVPPSVPGSMARHLADAIYPFFLPEQIAHALILHSEGASDPRIVDFLKTQPQETVLDIERQIARAMKPSPTYHLTFSLFTAGGSPSSWAVEQSLQDHVIPLVSAMAATLEVNIATQIQLYSSFAPSIEPLKIEGGFQLKKSDLTAFVNAAEWPLSPSIGTGPTINLIVYVPSAEQAPLTIEGNATNGWLIPQWGAISILNPNQATDADGKLAVPAHLTARDLDSVFETFASQLLSLLGVLEFEGHHSLPLRLRAHKRFVGLGLGSRASSSLGSLARVAQRLRQIPIPRHVAQLVDDSMKNLTAFEKRSKEGRWNEAMEHAADAYIDSEKAFFDKAMVGQVYFPDEHKVAVYLPLLGPIGVPLIVGLIKDIRRFLAARRAQPKTT